MIHMTKKSKLIKSNDEIVKLMRRRSLRNKSFTKDEIKKIKKHLKKLK